MENHIHWVIKILEKQGYCLTSFGPEKVQDMPWSEVYRFETEQGNIYLKKTPPALFIESDIIKLLVDKFHISVPIIIAENSREHFFLMRDAGILLRNYFKQYGFDQDIFIKALNDYAEFQYQTHNFTQDFLKLGVCDWNIGKISKLYEEAVYQEDFLKKIGLTFDEIKQCHQLVPIL